MYCLSFGNFVVISIITTIIWYGVGIGKIFGNWSFAVNTIIHFSLSIWFLSGFMPFVTCD